MTKTQLPKTVKRGKKRVGRGYGSGKGGHTAGRGQKGQKSRRSIGILFEGIKTRKSLLKRLPQLRGKEKNKSLQTTVNITTSDLEVFRSGSTVDAKALLEAGLIKKGDLGSKIKVLAGNKLTKKLTVQLSTSASARKTIEKAGGKVI